MFLINGGIMLVRKMVKRLSVIIAVGFLLISSSFAETNYKVKSSDSLSRIANKFYKNSKLSRHQIYIGILAENPNAFGWGNINFLKGGQTLVLPDSDNLLAMDAKDAQSLVKDHNRAAKKSKKIKLSPPFESYKPKNQSKSINAIAKETQMATQKLQELDSESEALRIRLEQLTADKEAMDAEILQLESLLKQ